MAVFPLFVDLKGRKCIIVGGGKVAERKTETLLEFNTEIIIISPVVTERIQQLNKDNRLVVIEKNYSQEDLENAFIVVAATNDSKVNEKIYNDAVKNNIFVNVADSKERCTFVFPSIVKRDELVVGVSSSGNYPALSKKIREKIDSVIPRELGNMVKILKAFRTRVKLLPDTDKRRELLNRIADEIVFNDEVETENQLENKLNNIFEEYKK